LKEVGEDAMNKLKLY
jgi:hypothetical protein